MPCSTPSVVSTPRRGELVANRAVAPPLFVAQTCMRLSLVVTTTTRPFALTMGDFHIELRMHGVPMRLISVLAPVSNGSSDLRFVISSQLGHF